MNLQIIKKNIRGIGMYLVLFVLMIFFTITTGGIFMSSRNLSNLFDQTGYIAVMACAMTLVLIILQIDLSVGYVAGFTGAIAAMLMMHFPRLPVIAVIVIILAIGAAIGSYHGFVIAKLGVPAFVVTLAGQFLFRGALLRVTEGTGTIIVKNDFFNALGNGFLPDIHSGTSFHLLTLLFGIVLTALFIVSQIRERNQKRKYSLIDVPFDMFIIKCVLFSFLILFFTYKLAMYNGISWTVAIVLVVIAIFHFVTTNTVFGRYIYAVGGNREAAELSGINSSNIIFFTMVISSVCASLAGILYTARLQSATPSAGVSFELDAIASAYIGGTATTGGVGKITGTIIGALVISSLANGMNLMNVGQSYQYMVRGLVLVAAVLFDVRSRRIKA
ncbi:MAG: sugar ABC transporter permease [Treponema sp.]|nr:sugar ABC transporter permease [Treponema sp.]